MGHIDLEKENIQMPDLASFMPHNKEFFIKESRVMRNGNSTKVTPDEYLFLLKKGYIYGFFDDYKKLEQWLSEFIEDYPTNYETVW